MTIGSSVAYFPTEGKLSEGESKDFYGFVWNRIRALAPKATLLRGPVHLNPIHGAAWGDLDILIPTDLEPVREFLIQQGFVRVFKLQPYLERYWLRKGTPLKSYTVDLHNAELWGWGFRLARRSQVPAKASTACLLHAIVDGKGTAYFERNQAGPAWQSDDFAGKTFGPLGRALWRTGDTGLLTLYLLLRGVIRPDLAMILRSLWRLAAFRVLQLTRKMGLEVALLGVDGTGKSSLASALRQLPAPVKVVYMGPHDYATWIMKFTIRHRLPLPFQQLAYRYELLVRRLYGWLLARRGWIVVYDRHPAERLDPRQRSLAGRLKNAVDRLYAWPVDLTFWLTGNYQIMYQRKKEYSAAELQKIDQRFQSVLAHYGIPFEKVDVTRNDLNAVADRVSKQVLAKHEERLRLDRLPGVIKATLV